VLAQTLIEPDEAHAAAAAEMLVGSPGVVESSAPSAPIEPTWRDIWLTVTPIWIVLAFSRVLFYGLERLRFPEIVPPVWADAVQAIVLWPLVTLCCAIVLRRWVRSGWRLALLVALGTTLVIGFAARPAYAFGALLNSGNNVESQAWLTAFVSGQPQSWYPWLSNAVEYGVLYLSCVVAAVGFLTYRTLMHERLHLSRVEAAAAHERLRTLRSQLNPHFLFNALNSIVGLSDHQGALTQQVITQLSDLLRRTLRASELEVHGLTEELSHVDSYLQIQQVRQPSRIDWRVNLDLQSINTPVPSLILLPLVENAITHGLRGSARV